MTSSTATVAVTEAKKSKKYYKAVPEMETQTQSTLQKMYEVEEDETSAPPASSPSSKKRKRDSDAGPELEIDVSLPEPPSKKALRKAKKQKPTSTTITANDASSSRRPAASTPSPEPTATTAPDHSSTAASTYGIWIGNLPFAATKPTLRTFLTTAAPGLISDAAITRVHMPAPAHAAATRTQVKPQNKGFAYVDFASREALEAALALSESSMGGRKVLIKDAKSFEGRPEKVKGAEGAAAAGAGAGGDTKMKRPTKRVFVGNLGFDVTKEDLVEQFKRCGEVTDVHMATFEDSGKCKGFAWVTFEGEEAAEAAVRGWVRIAEEGSGDDHDEQEGRTDKPDESEEDAAINTETGVKPAARKEKKQTTRKWFVNRLQGRPLRCEFAEDPTSRYKKRFGKDPAAVGAEGVVESNIGAEPRAGAGKRTKRAPRSATAGGIRPGAPTDSSKRRGRTGAEDAGVGVGGERRGGHPAPGTMYRTGAITEATGSKVTFD